MKLIAAFLALVPAALLFGLAYTAYADNAAENANRHGMEYDKYVFRASDDFSIFHAQQEGRLTLAGLEGLGGLAFLGLSLALCAPEKKAWAAEHGHHPRQRMMPLREAAREEAKRGSETVEAEGTDPRPHHHSHATHAGGRDRIEELRRVRSRLVRRRRE